MLPFAIYCSCSTNVQINNERVIESGEVEFSDSVKRPFTKYVYDDKGILISSVIISYGKDSVGNIKEQYIRTSNYTHLGRTINIDGVEKIIDINTGDSHNKDIKVILKCNGSGKIVKRIEQPEGYVLPIIDEFEWEGNCIKRKIRYYDGELANGSYEDIVEYKYRDGNMVSANMKTLIVVNDVRTTITGTIKCEYDTTHLSYQTNPDESVLIVNHNLELFAAKHSANQLTSYIWESTLQELDMVKRIKIQNIYSTDTSLIKIDRYDEKDYPIISNYTRKVKSKLDSYIDPQQSKKTEENINFIVFTKYTNL